jgi:hypothetical protein
MTKHWEKRLLNRTEGRLIENTHGWYTIKVPITFKTLLTIHLDIRRLKPTLTIWQQPLQIAHQVEENGRNVFGTSHMPP